jgi:hypothetical protein
MLLKIIAQSNYYQGTGIRFHSIYTDAPIMVNVSGITRAIRKVRINFAEMEGTHLTTSNGGSILICADTILFKSVIRELVPDLLIDPIWDSMVKEYGDTLAGEPLEKLRGTDELKSLLSTFLL